MLEAKKLVLSDNPHKVGMMSKMWLCTLSALLSWTAAAAHVPYSNYALTPRSRTLRPVHVYHVNGTVDAAEDLLTSQAAKTTFRGRSAVTYDFGQNVAGLVVFSISTVVGSEESVVGVSFTESSLWISDKTSDTTNALFDQALWWSVESNGSYKAEKQYQRGGFRYLNVYHNTTAEVTMSDLTVYYTAIPHYSEEQLAAGIQTGYFHCEDEQINRIWYAGAYTNELCTIDPTAGNSLIFLNYSGTTTASSAAAAFDLSWGIPWWNNDTISNGSAALVDGGKRDRLIWPGDILVSQPGIFVSSYDMGMLRDSLDSLLVLQNSSGALPWAGQPFAFFQPDWSFTYHLHTLTDISQYFLYTDDEPYLQKNWGLYKLALNFSFSFIDESGMAYIPTPNDWLRFGMGGHNIEANSILYYNLVQGIALADHLNDTSEFVQTWPLIAEKIKLSTNEALWDPEHNLYRDKDTQPLTNLYPQDGNAWAIISNLTLDAERAFSISEALQARWGPYGAPAPEAADTVSPFASGFELQAHYISGRPRAAVELIKFMWGDFMLDDLRMTNSTFIEGYSTNGELHYAPYSDDARISHAHGWSTSPTSTLTFFAAGLQVTSAAGKTWLIEPQLGGLHNVEAGFQTNIGSFSSNVTAIRGGGLSITCSTPTGTSGNIRLRYPGGSASLTVTDLGEQRSEQGLPRSIFEREVSSNEQDAKVVSITGLPGGRYNVVLKVYD